ncbi:hypothetical protein ROM48_06210 [Cronobacter malonaticus]|uniref:hypothetical protein n=1 Tax=Cronobacter malonaticus TaxID=413503 RepID=UPI0028943184|nr:hypothetical protein [Cronobacter malonaticus]MDT3535611.1 hypothetical protein [Cronobacter malonaticus]
MKLIDLLVQELPKRGGWPDNTTALVQNSSGYVYQAGGGDSFFHFKRADDWELAEITSEQYEAALAAAQQPVWDGEGLPPVGCECERECPGGWVACRINYVSEKHIVYTMTSSGTEYSSLVGNYRFRPIRSEADKRRDEAIAALKKLKPQLVGELAGYLYDEIAAGKIPHIRIERAA